jgi:anti-sigma factor RsiW
MTCKDGVALLPDYLEDTLDAARRRALDTHVSGCVRCQRFVTSYVATPTVYRRATEETMPDRLREKLRRRLGLR